MKQECPGALAANPGQSNCRWTEGINGSSPLIPKPLLTREEYYVSATSHVPSFIIGPPPFLRKKSMGHTDGIRQEKIRSETQNKRHQVFATLLRMNANISVPTIA